MSDELSVPKWGDPIESIPDERRTELMRLHDEQVKWSTEPVRDIDQSPFAKATHKWLDVYPLDGAEVFFLAVYVLSKPGGDFSTATERARAGPPNLLDDLHLEGVNLYHTHLEGAKLGKVHLEGAKLNGVHLKRADLRAAHLQRADLTAAYLEDAYFGDAHLEGADFHWAHLEGANLVAAHLDGAALARAFCNTATNLINATVCDNLHGPIRVADVHWQGVNLAVVMEWPEDMVLGDERDAHDLERMPLTEGRYSDELLSKKATREERQAAKQDRYEWLVEVWRDAVRANRQLAIAMRDQGMNTEADHFAYRGNLCQRQLYRVQGKHLRRFGSWLLDLVSGYGYEPIRSVITYLLVVIVFGLAYWVIGVATGHTLTWNEAGVVSLTAFHGRGFFATAFKPGDPQAALAAIEAVIGLLIEITFIATFTQRFFAR